MTILIAGIHGAGKTFLTEKAAQQLSLDYAEASQLIREERGRTTWSADKQVGEIAENQLALVAAVNKIKYDGRTLLLNGHMILRKSVNQHERLPYAVFRGLNCRMIILLTCSTQSAKERLEKRGDFSWNTEELEKLAKTELEHAKAVTNDLHIPLVSLFEPSLDKFMETINRLPRKTNTELY